MSIKIVLCFGAIISAALAAPFLTPREEQLMKDNIALIATDIPTHAMNIFIDLFTVRPEYQALFKNFKDTPFENLRNDPALGRHSVNILTTIATVISAYMHDSDTLYEKFLEVAQHHIPRRVSQRHMAVLKEVVLNYLHTALEGALPADDLRDLLVAWDKILSLAYNAFTAVN